MSTTEVMWKAIVYAEGRTSCGISEGIPEVLPGLYATAAQANAVAVAAMDARPQLYSSAVRRVEVTTD